MNPNNIRKEPQTTDRGQQIIDEEYNLLRRVVLALQDQEKRQHLRPDFSAKLISLRDQIRDAKAEDVAPLVEEMTRVSALASRYGKSIDLPLDQNNPYFAHLRLDQPEGIRDILIGKRAYVDRNKGIQVVDWRNAPVSQIYYRYQENDDYEEYFGQHLVEGHVQVRRSLTIVQGTLLRIAAPQGTFMKQLDGTWREDHMIGLAELSGGQGKAKRIPAIKAGNPTGTLGETFATQSGRPTLSDKHLTEITALIDPNQFSAITDPSSGLVVLQGGAGTGKTTVALHRLAYLMYQRPKRYRPGSVAVIVPTVAVARYVERVLPTLGIAGVQVLTASRWIHKLRKKILQNDPRPTRDEAPALVRRFKKHPLLLNIMHDFVSKEEANCNAILERTLSVNTGNSKSAQSLVQLWRSHSSLPLGARLRMLGDEAAARRTTTSERHRYISTITQCVRRTEDLLGMWSDIFCDRSYLLDMVARHLPDGFTDREIDTIAKWCTRQVADLDIASQKGEPLGTGDTTIAVDGKAERDGQLTEPWIEPEDNAHLLYLSLLLNGQLLRSNHKPLKYSHLVVDEAQDLCAIELKVLVGSCQPARNLTLSGDVAQRVVFDNGFTTWEEWLARLEIPIDINTTLKLAYRSTGEIMELAHHVLGDTSVSATKRSPPNITRRGAPVELHAFNEEGEAIAVLSEALRSLQQREPLASVALIARYATQAAAYASALRRADLPQIRLVEEYRFSFKPGIEVTDVLQVKGLEFDYVILLDVSAQIYPDTDISRHLLHIGLTRAAHQVWLTSVGTPSPLLPAPSQ